MARRRPDNAWGGAHNRKPLKTSMRDLGRRRSRRHSNWITRMYRNDETLIRAAHNSGPWQKQEGSL